MSEPTEEFLDLVAESECSFASAVDARTTEGAARYTKEGHDFLRQAYQSAFNDGISYINDMYELHFQ